MRYDLETSLLPASVAEGERAVRVPFDALPDRGLLLFDEGVSDFWFELNPRRDAELFLRNAHFGCMAGGVLTIGYESLFEVMALPATGPPPPILTIPPEGEPPLPLRFVPLRAALVEARRASE
jgi:hypothetical protein